MGSAAGDHSFHIHFGPATRVRFPPELERRFPQGPTNRPGSRRFGGELCIRLGEVCDTNARVSESPLSVAKCRAIGERHSAMEVSAMTRNEGAIRLYERRGFKPTKATLFRTFGN